MKRKLTYLLGLLLTTSALWAGDCVESVKGFHGPLDDPYQITTDQYITINPTDNHSKVLPLTPNENFTVYAVDAGRVRSADNPTATVARITIEPTASAPYLALWFASEVGTGPGDHEPLTGSIRVHTPKGVEDQRYEFVGDENQMTAQGFIKTTQYWSDSITIFTYYCPWQFYIYDLSPYIGQTITVEVTSTTCTTHNCSSIIYMAFDCFAIYDDVSCNVCYSCDEVNLHAPSGNQSYAWHVGSFSGPVVGTDSVLILPGKWNIANYFCEIQGAYGELKLVAPVQDVRSVFSYDLHCGEGDAKDTVYFTNTSFKQKRIAPYTMETCDAYYWDFGNGQTSTARDPGYVLYNKGQQVTVRLRTGTEDFACDAWSDATFRTCDREDSIPLNPMPNIPVTDSIDSVVCHGNVVEWRDLHLTETGIYRDTLLSKTWGTDSIYYVLNLTVLAEPVEIPLKDTTSCNLVPFLWRGHQIVGDTLCHDTLRTTQLGCDSIYASLRFVVKEPASSDTTAYTCYGTPFIWHGKVAVNGDTIMRKNAVGCDSIVTLHLLVSAAPITQTFDTTVCDTLLPFTWRGWVYDKPTTYRDTFYTTLGCDSVYRPFRLDTFHCVRPEPPVPPEPPVDTCLSDLVYRKWNDVLFCDNGQHQIVTFQWYRDNVELAGETKQYYFHDGGIDGAEYFVEITYTDGTKWRTCPLTFGSTPRSANTYVKVQTVVRRGAALHIEMSDPEADVAIYTVVGQPVLTAHILGSQSSIQVPLPTGAYVLLLHGDNVETTTKIIVE